MNEVEEIKQRLDIVDFISQYLTLKKSGVNHKGLCPFHNEKTPSFMVSADKQIFKCFGCGAGGDVIEFLMKMENLEFPEALAILADKTGVAINKKSPKQFIQEKEVKSRYYKINNLSAKVFKKILTDHPAGKIARDYLKKRKISSATIEKFQIGYAPKKAVLASFLRQHGFLDKEINSAGSPDRFYHRIMFPIFDILGNVVGFSGRVLDSQDQPKYLNTAETPIFFKSRSLYGLNFAKAEIKDKKSVIIVEGQMDVVLSHQAGVTNAVASSGTALTISQLEILSRYTSKIIFAFDQDEAGSKACQKALEMGISLGLNCQIIIFPSEFKDTGEVVERDPKLWQNLVKKPLDAMEWIFSQAIGKKTSFTASEKKEIAQKTLPFIRIIDDDIERTHWLKILAKKIDTPAEVIFDALKKIKVAHKKSAPVISGTKTNAEENLVGLILTNPSCLDKIINKIDYSDFSEGSQEGQIYKIIQSCYTKDSKIDQKHFLKAMPAELAQKANFLILSKLGLQKMLWTIDTR
ncbi:MAG: DNA primase, partial [Patescibacteria group bacterium]|nr:DNA primase [Patescibacteria group bacterium]